MSEEITPLRLPGRFAGHSVSVGTMRRQDLIPAFYEFLLKNEPALARAIYDQLCQGVYGECDEQAALLAGTVADDDPLWDCEEAAILLGDLYSALNEIAPKHCTFGSHPGNGSDFGFWPEKPWYDPEGWIERD